MKRGISCVAFVLTILTLCMGPNLTWARDTNSRLFQLAPGVLPIGAPAFNGTQIELSGNGTTIRSVSEVGSKGHAAVTLPFKCTIVGMEARVRNEDPSSDVYVELHDGECLNANCDTRVPIVSIDTSKEDPSSNAIVISSEAFSYEYDPTDLIKQPLWITVQLDTYWALPPSISSRQRLWWVKIYYTVP